MAKFKAGDKVKVRKDLKVGKQYYMDSSKICDRFVDSMAKWRGKVVTIEGVGAGEKYFIKEAGYNWTDEMFEPAAVIGGPEEDLAENSWQPIVIYQRGDAVVALDGNTGTDCTAIDTTGDFNFYEGARVAAIALIDKLTDEKDPDCKFQVGDIVIALPDNDYGITTDGWLGRVTTVHPNGLIDLYGLMANNERFMTFTYLNPGAFRLADDEEIPVSWMKKLYEDAID